MVMRRDKKLVPDGREWTSRISLLLFLSIAAAAGAFEAGCDTNKPSSTSTAFSGKVPSGADAALNDDGDWAMAAKDYANTRYSTLNEINTGNVSQMKASWTFSTGVERGHESAPLIVGDTMYIVTPYPNILYALDLKNNGSQKWSYEPK